MVQTLMTLAYVLAIYHGIALFVDYAAVKALLGSGHMSVMFALLERDLMSGMVRTYAAKAARHAVWCAALVIFLAIL